MQLPNYLTVLEELATGFAPEKGMPAYVYVRDSESGRYIGRAGRDLDDARQRVLWAAQGRHDDPDGDVQPVKQNRSTTRNDMESIPLSRVTRQECTVAKNSFSGLDSLANLEVQTYKKGDRAGVRKVTASKQDEISEKMAGLTKPSELAQFASEFGIDSKVITERAQKAPNFGQFRMLIGNLTRGVLNRFQKAQADPACKGKVELADCATPDTFMAKMRELHPKPVKEAKAPAPKAAAKGAAAPVGGAKSKQEQAKSGKGTKPKASKQKPIKTVDDDAVAAGAGADNAAADSNFAA